MNIKMTNPTKRSLLFYFSTNEKKLAPWYYDDIDLNTPVKVIFTHLAKANNALVEIEGLSLLSIEISDYILYDWNEMEIEPDTPVRRIANPGIIFAILRESKEEKTLASAAKTYVQTFAKMDPAQKELLDSFLFGTKGDFHPIEYDVFISYTQADEAIAEEIMDILAGENITCFMAKKEIKTGVIWEDKIRGILSMVSAAVVIITPRSINSNWVMSESGAFWVLNKPIFPALMYINPRDLPELISKYQSIDIVSALNRKRLCENLISQCKLEYSGS